MPAETGPPVRALQARFPPDAPCWSVATRFVGTAPPRPPRRLDPFTRPIASPIPRPLSLRIAFTRRPLRVPSHIKGPVMTTPVDPWDRPSLDDLRAVLESIDRCDALHERQAERIELAVPAEIRTARGNTVSAMTREISRLGLGLLHRGSVQPGEVVVKMASETRNYEYRLRIEWCVPCESGMFMSGGSFLAKPNSQADSE